MGGGDFGQGQVVLAQNRRSVLGAEGRLLELAGGA